MRKLIRPLAFTAVLGLTGSLGLSVLRAIPDEPKPAAVKPDVPAAPVKFTDTKIETKFAVTPKPLSAGVKNGITFLLKSQQEDGGWSQGGGWRTNNAGGGRVEGKNVEDPSDIGNSCFVILSLIRAGSTPAEGEHKAAVAKALKYILTKVEKADKDSLYVTDVKGTQLQSKIGPYVDTFLVNLVLAELKGKAGEDEKRLTAALEKTMNKIVKHQDEKGGFANNGGWAPTLSVGIANKSFARAKQNGVMVDDKVFDRAFAQADGAARGTGAMAGGPAVGGAGFAGGSGPPAAFSGRSVATSSKPVSSGTVVTGDRVVLPAPLPAGPTWMTEAFAAARKADATKIDTLALGTKASTTEYFSSRGAAMPPGAGGGFGGGGFGGGGGGDAGVRLYSLGQGAGNAQDVVNSLRIDGEKAKKVLDDVKATAGEKKDAQGKLDNLKRAETTNYAVQEELSKNVRSDTFVAGFGSNGGEEFLSFLNISEALLVKGGKDWTDWDAKMVKGLEKAQDKDGSWAGHHCITGKTFCTAGALLVLLADRTPFPLDVLKKDEKKPESPTPDPAKPAAAIPIKP